MTDRNSENFFRSMDENTKPNGAGAPRGRFTLTRFAYMKSDVSRPYIVQTLLPRGGLIVVWGPPKCGKSFWVSDLALHVALGRTYRGRRVEAGIVVYITCEGQSGFPARMEAFRRRKLQKSDDPDPPFYLLPTRLDLVGEVDRLIAEIADQIGEAGPVLIVIDTLNRSLVGSESKDEGMSRYVQACDRIREAFHCAVLVVHHCGTNDQRPRGHTALTGAADTQIAVRRDKAGNIIATVEYMKDGPEGDEIISRLVPVDDIGVDEDGEPISSCIVEPSTTDPITGKTNRSSRPKTRSLSMRCKRRSPRTENRPQHTTTSPAMLPSSPSICGDTSTCQTQVLMGSPKTRAIEHGAGAATLYKPRRSCSSAMKWSGPRDWRTNRFIRNPDRPDKFLTAGQSPDKTPARRSLQNVRTTDRLILEAYTRTNRTNLYKRLSVVRSSLSETITAERKDRGDPGPFSRACCRRLPRPRHQLDPVGRDAAQTDATVDPRRTERPVLHRSVDISITL
jgi:hypothetical protein